MGRHEEVREGPGQWVYAKALVNRTEKYDTTASALAKWLTLPISKGVESRSKPLRLKLQATSFLLHLMCICT